MPHLSVIPYLPFCDLHLSKTESCMSDITQGKGSGDKENGNVRDSTV